MNTNSDAVVQLIFLLITHTL